MKAIHHSFLRRRLLITLLLCFVGVTMLGTHRLLRKQEAGDLSPEVKTVLKGWLCWEYGGFIEQ